VEADPVTDAVANSADPGADGPAGRGAGSMEELSAALVARPLGGGRFVAGSPDWWGGDRVFGGMVVAQALSAAIQTVERATPVHSMHAYFLRPSLPGRPVDLVVHRVRDGRSFSTREVTSSVDGKVTFQMACSFHGDEPGDEYQLAMPEVPGPDDVEQADVPIPFLVRELGPSPRRPDGSYGSTRRVWLRTRTPLADDPLLHTCVVAYLSDMTGAAFRPKSLGTWGTHTDASLDHSLWFHRPVRADQWLLFDLQALVNAGGRATVRGVMFDREGRLVVSMAQELLIRPLEDPEPESAPAWSSTTW
jgi:acyl-CoA thioesterase-2